MSNPCIIVQARMGGERFPGKVLAPFFGEPMLHWQLARLHQTSIPGCRVIVAYPETPANRVLKLWCDAWQEEALAYPGPENDVLGRYAYVAAQYEADPILRVTADTPLLDPEVIRLLWEGWEAQPSLDHYGIAGNFADGQDCEIFSAEALQRAHHEAASPSDREHTTPFLWRQPDIFQCATMPCERDCSWQQYSVDTPDDLALAALLAEKGHTWQDFDRLLTTDTALRVFHDQRLPRNHRYVQQVASEQGTAHQSWETIRYGPHP